MRFDHPLDIVIGLFVVVSASAAIIAAVAGRMEQIVRPVTRFFRAMANFGYGLRDRKDKLVPLMRFMPLSPNQQTILRGIILNILNWLWAHGHFPSSSLFWFLLGWSLDVTDGLTAKYWKSIGRVRTSNKPWMIWWHRQSGKYLDPTVDIPTMLITAFVLRTYYPHQILVTLLLAATALRFILYPLFRLWVISVGANLPGILPSNIAGQSKTWFLAASFALVVIRHTSDTALFWAELCFAVGLVLELFGLLSAIKTIYQDLILWRQHKT